MMGNQPTISQYLLSTCLFIIDEFNENFSSVNKEELKIISDTKFNEMDITVKIGYPFRQMVHYTVGDKKDKELTKSNHDLYIESKDFKIEVKFLKNYKSNSGTYSGTKNWSEYEQDFEWLFDEINAGNKNKRAFVIGWFNCVDYFSRIIQLGDKSGKKPIINEQKVCYFPFLKKMKVPTYTTDLVYNYDLAYKEVSLNLIGKTGDYNCLFLGNERDVFHFAIYY